MNNRRLSLLSVLLIVLVSRSWAQHDEYDYGYGYDSYDAEEDHSYDEYVYYDDGDKASYKHYGYYADDFAGYEDSTGHGVFRECFSDANGKPVLASGTADCDIKISGVDNHVSKLTGGVDGVYKLTACYNGKALYMRRSSPAGEDRVLWYSIIFANWEISRGIKPKQAQVLMYSGGIERASLPLLVSSWHLNTDYKTDTNLGEDEYLPMNVYVSCADGTVYANDGVPTNTSKSSPLLTDTEIDTKYEYIYDEYVPKDKSIYDTFAAKFVYICAKFAKAVQWAIGWSFDKKGLGSTRRG